MAHYAYRSFIFPLRMRGGKPMPIGVCLLATAFCAFNGYVQGRAWTAFVLLDASTSLRAALLVAGAAVWAGGLYINLDADARLRNLRSPSERSTGVYKIPRGGAFELVSGANYFGEIVEWCGYALASGGALPAVAFAFFTFSNTAPRAYHHHLWYLRKFADYPPSRRAVIPYVW
jgi:3-oxo-5-alpha-steroid 4-dehydrogenase 1